MINSIYNLYIYTESVEFLPYIENVNSISSSECR